MSIFFFGANGFQCGGTKQLQRRTYSILHKCSRDHILPGPAGEDALLFSFDAVAPALRHAAGGKASEQKWLKKKKRLSLLDVCSNWLTELLLSCHAVGLSTLVTEHHGDTWFLQSPRPQEGQL